MAQSQAHVHVIGTHREPCNIMHSLERIYWKNITYAFKMSFHSNSTDISLAVEGHKLGLHDPQIGKNDNNNSKKNV